MGFLALLYPILCLHFMLFYFVQPLPLCHPDQKLALLQFKSSFSYVNSTTFHFRCDQSYPTTSSWKNENVMEDCCSWEGVTCDTALGHVISLDLNCSWLQGNQFNGPIPSSSFSNLQLLTHLDFSANKLEGRLPPSLFELSQISLLRSSNNQLIGPIPNRIVRYSNLEYLDLSSNFLNGTIPSWCYSLPALRHLNLGHNQFTGHITKISSYSLEELDLSSNKLYSSFPKSIYDLQNLTSLSLSSNNLSGLVDLDMLPQNLQLLDLSENSLLTFSLNTNTHATIPDLQELYLSSCNISNFLNFKYFHNLRTLHLSNILYFSSNNLSDLVDLVRLSKNLIDLDLSRNNFPSFSLDINDNDSTFPNLQEVNLSSCNLTTFPKFLKSLHMLEWLDLSNNKICGNVPKWMLGKDSMYYLKLSHNSLTGIDSQISWHHLEYLDLSSNLLQGELPLPPNSTNMVFFSVANNKLSGNISPSIFHLSNARSLGTLVLSHNNFSGKIPRCIGSFHRYLQVLDLKMNNLSGIIPPQIFQKGNMLTTLNFNGNQLEGTLPSSLALCKELQVLDVGNNKLEDTFPNWLETLQELQVLILRGNKFHGIIRDSKAKDSFPKLRIFDISNNKFTGHLPTSFLEHFKAMMNLHEGKTQVEYMRIPGYYDSVTVTMKGLVFFLERILTIFTTIDFSKNKFDGEIPELIGKLQSLKGINLSHNYLTGSIPKSMGNLTNLEWLDLSWNNLKGEIPIELININGLSDLKLSHNKLVGCIPGGKQFNTFTNDSYEGNLGLRGFPLSSTCGRDERKQPPSSAEEDDEESGFGWKAVAVGYGCGAIFGMSMGYFVFSKGKPKWLLRMIEGNDYHRSSKRVKRPRNNNARGGVRRN
ncbi:Receptor-like protein [Quillaja saponaria]|uniref:Receptor-like protein n=1 Tax=Quillaja saponaria TaxID=32244 RepID=A0AAD7LT53_QUISA|nr:Receptor-like protein [Quillaja saponaria]